MNFIIVIAILLGLAGLAYVYREKLEAFLPGWKTNLWNGAIVVVSSLSWVQAWAEKFDWFMIPNLSPTVIALIGVAIGGVGLIISLLTKRLDRNGDGKLDDADKL